MVPGSIKEFLLTFDFPVGGTSKRGQLRVNNFKKKKKKSKVEAFVFSFPGI